MSQWLYLMGIFVGACAGSWFGAWLGGRMNRKKDDRQHQQQMADMDQRIDRLVKLRKPG